MKCCIFLFRGKSLWTKPMSEWWCMYRYWGRYIQMSMCTRIQRTPLWRYFQYFQFPMILTFKNIENCERLLLQLETIKQKPILINKNTIHNWKFDWGSSANLCISLHSPHIPLKLYRWRWLKKVSSKDMSSLMLIFNFFFKQRMYHRVTSALVWTKGLVSTNSTNTNVFVRMVTMALTVKVSFLKILI